MVDKIVMLLDQRRLDQDEFESLAGLARGRISKWKADQGEPTASQTLRMARLLQVSMEFLADESIDEPLPPPAEHFLFNEDERAIIELYRDLELNRQEAVKRLATPLATGQVWLPGSVRDHTPPKPSGPRRPPRAKPAADYPDATGSRRRGGEPLPDEHPPRKRRKGG